MHHAGSIHRESIREVFARCCYSQSRRKACSYAVGTSVGLSTEEEQNADLRMTAIFAIHIMSYVRLGEDAERFVALQRHAESITVSP